MAAHPGGEWWEFVPEVARALRMLPVNASGLSPYLLVFKHKPTIPLQNCVAWGEELEVEQVNEQDAWLATASADKLYEAVRARL